MTQTTLHSIDLAEVPAANAQGAPLIDKNFGLVGHVPVSLSVLVGSVSLTIEQLFALKKGAVIAMNEALDAPITLQLNGKAVASGELVAVDDNFGIRITALA